MTKIIENAVSFVQNNSNAIIEEGFSENADVEDGVNMNLFKYSDDSDRIDSANDCPKKQTFQDAHRTIVRIIQSRHETS